MNCDARTCVPHVVFVDGHMACIIRINLNRRETGRTRRWMDGTQGNRKRSVGSLFHPRSEDAAAAQVARWTSPLHAPLPHFVYTIMSIGEATIRAYAIISARVCARESIFNPCPPTTTWPQVNSRSLRKHDFKNPRDHRSRVTRGIGIDRILNNNAILLSYLFIYFFFVPMNHDRWNQ